MHKTTLPQGKRKLEPPYDPVLPFLSKYLKVWKTGFQKMHVPMHIATVFSSSYMEATYLLTDGRMDFKNEACAYNGVSYTLRKERDSDTCCEVGTPLLHYTVLNKPQIDKHGDHSYVALRVS